VTALMAKVLLLGNPNQWYPIGTGFMAVNNSLRVDGKLPAGRLFKKWSHPDTISHKV